MFGGFVKQQEGPTVTMPIVSGREGSSQAPDGCLSGEVKEGIRVPNWLFPIGGPLVGMGSGFYIDVFRNGQWTRQLPTDENYEAPGTHAIPTWVNTGGWGLGCRLGSDPRGVREKVVFDVEEEADIFLFAAWRGPRQPDLS